jgi:oligopeptide transport system substrate-binding protein
MSPRLRNIRVGVGLVLVALGVAGGCAKRESAADAAARAGILRQSLGNSDVELDPHRASTVADGNVLRALFEGLVVPDPRSLEPRPGVAETWDVSPDGRQYTFHLRANARWSNGDPVTAVDFAGSIRRALTPELGAINVYLFFPLRGARAYYEKSSTDFSSVGVEAPDARTLRLTLEQPTPHFLTTLLHFAWLPVHLPSIRASGGETATDNVWTTPERMVSNGAFRLAEVARQQFIRLEPSPTYWDAGAVRLRGVMLFAFSSVEVEERSFRAGELHVTDALPVGKIRTYRERDPRLLHVAPSYALYFYRFNTTRSPFDDPRVRRALAAAIDRPALVGGVFAGVHPPARSFTPPGAAGYEPPALVVDDPEAARRLLAEAGFPGGRGLRAVEILYNRSENHQLVSEVVQENWRRVLGIETALASQEYSVFLHNRQALNYDVCRASWFADYLDPLGFLEILTTGNANNQTGWSNAEFDRLVAEAARAPEAAQRLALLRDAETILLSEMPVIPLYVQSTVRLVDPRVDGWFDNPMDLHLHKHLGFSLP